MGQLFNRAAGGLATILGAAAMPALAHATEPQQWEVWMQPAATPVAERMHAFNSLLTVIIIAITVFVAGLLLYVMIRFRASAHPTPSKTSHNTMVEVLWTVLPVMILVIIAVPSFRLLYYGDKAADAQMTIKVVGHQWYWEYQYPDAKGLAIESRLVQDADLKPGQPRLLTVDNPLVVPVNTTVRVLVSSEDVIHSWLIPSFGVQKYAMPGRTNETWFKAEKTGTYYGQCNQICGFDHGFMPVEVQVVTADDYKSWLAKAQAQAGLAPAPVTSVAALTPASVN